MAKRKIPARDIIIQVSDGATPTETWIEIGGLTSATPNPGENEETVDTTDFDSDGAYEQVIMQRGATLEIEGSMLKDDTTGEQDAGQARLETLGAAVGYASLGRARFRHPMDTVWKIWTCTVSLAEQGGGNNDMTSWGATLTRSGASTTEEVV